MKKINIKLLAGLLFTLLAVNACTEKDLETQATTENSVSFYEKEENVEAAIWMMYDGLRVRTGPWGNSQILWGTLPSEDVYAGGSGITDQIGYQNADTYESSPNDPSGNLGAMWQISFQGIYACNTVLEYSKDDKDFKRSARAEAKFLKGFYYFYLTRMFGGLPLIKKMPLPSDQIVRSSYEETLAYIEELLTEAVNDKLLDGVTPAMQSKTGLTASMNGRATLASAQTLLGKVLIYEKKYKEAIAVLEKVASNPNYQLENDYHRVFKGYNKHGVESIFEINYTKLPGARSEAMGNGEIQLMGVRSTETSKINDTIAPGWGFNQPTLTLVNAYKAMGDMVRLNGTCISTDSLNVLDSLYFLKTGGTSANFKRRTWENNPGGWWDKKHYVEPANQGTAWGNIKNNTIVLRLADAYLLLAEAYNKDGQDANALIYVNKVRERAKLPALSVTGSALTDAIKMERRLELALEGDRYFDLVRWGDADAVLGPLGYANGTPGTKTKGFYPIPLAELNRTSGEFKLNQNEGY